MVLQVRSVICVNVEEGSSKEGRKEYYMLWKLLNMICFDNKVLQKSIVQVLGLVCIIIICKCFYSV